MKKGRVVLAVLTLVLALIVVLGWMFVVPGELKTLIRFSRWHDAHVRSSGYVDRDPPGTRIYWEEFGTADGPPVAFGANHTPPPDGQDAEMTKQFKEARPDANMFFPLRYLYQRNSPTPDKWPEFFERERAMVFAGPNWPLADLGTIHVPVLLLNGEHDLVLRPYATAMKDVIPGARLEIVAGEGHELPLANPAKANAIMLAFLRQ